MSNEKLTLGQLIDKMRDIGPLENHYIRFDFDQDETVYPIYLDSYRGYYDELAIGYDSQKLHTAEVFLKKLVSAIYATFYGYKGGEYTMTRDTPLWVANRGRSFVENYKGEEYAHVGIIDVIFDSKTSEFILITQKEND